MSLYHEAAEVLESARKNRCSLKSVIFTKKDWKSDAKSLFALTTETSKWSEVLSEVIEKSGLLQAEKQLSPTLALLLTHDLLLSKKGLALPSKHGLVSTTTRHKARLTAELTKARLRRGFPTIDALRVDINNKANGGDETSPAAHAGPTRPRWIRINTLRTTLDEQLKSTFATYTRASKLHNVTNSRVNAKLVYIDENVSNLVAIPAGINIIGEIAYREGQIILQDKASCFPATLLDPSTVNGDLIDACAAPGNKTTHLAALSTSARLDHGAVSPKRRIFACERDDSRSQTLAKMVQLAGGSDRIYVKAKQDFMKLDPLSKEFANVTCLLLDPSCSGSGIIGRDDAGLDIHLPNAHKADLGASQGKKRKRDGSKAQSQPQAPPETTLEDEEVPTKLAADDSKLQTRLLALSTFQTRLLTHAMAFSAARRITYSTCSVYSEENEQVIVKALLSDVGIERGWRILERKDQVDGMRKWKKRGSAEATHEGLDHTHDGKPGLDAKVISDACIRCDKNSEDGTMGFFVAGFIRTPDRPLNGIPNLLNGSFETTSNKQEDEADDNDEGTEWNGFGDEDI